MTPWQLTRVSLSLHMKKRTPRYIGGSVCNNLRNKISKGHPLKQSLLIAIEDLAEDEPTKETTGDWMAQVDRGGLFHLNDGFLKEWS